jgi:dTMP kinase
MSPRAVPPTARAELLLYLADRDQHLAEVVLPAMARGDVVLTDRFSASTVAYQGYGRELDVDTVVRLDEMVRHGLMPHLTFLYDCPVPVGLARARGNDRFHDEDEAFHARVRDGLLAQAREAPERYTVIDATQPAETIHEQTLAALLTRLQAR